MVKQYIKTLEALNPTCCGEFEDGELQDSTFKALHFNFRIRLAIGLLRSFIAFHIIRFMCIFSSVPGRGIPALGFFTWTGLGFIAVFGYFVWLPINGVFSFFEDYFRWSQIWFIIPTDVPVHWTVIPNWDIMRDRILLLEIFSLTIYLRRVRGTSKFDGIGSVGQDFIREQ